MKYRLALIGFFAAICLASCNLPEATQSPASRMNDIQTEAALQVTPVFKTPTITSTATSTKTQIPSTPTAYPTFYPELAVTVTPAQPAVCPVEDPDFEFSAELLKSWHPYKGLEFANTALKEGASFSQIANKVKQLTEGSDLIIAEDITGDNVNELVIASYSGVNDVTAITCDQGEFREILTFKTYNSFSFAPAIINTDDLNLNGLPDVVIAYHGSPGGNVSIAIYEWNGYEMEYILASDHGKNAEQTSRFANGLYWNLLSNHEVWDVPQSYYPFTMNNSGIIKFVDTDHNGTKEIVIKDSGPLRMDWFYETGPWLGQQVTFTWNGESFLLSDYQIDVPYYRYQTLQEADRLFLMRDYDQASILYDKVVGSEMLEWYSLDRKKYFWDVYSAKQAGKDPSKVTLPYFRADEYQYLSAYARYRKMMMLLAEGKQADAYYVYQLLDQIYTQQNPGFWHAEMGRIYWKAVEEGMSLTDACQPVIEYVEQNPKLLEALGDQWHGQQSHIYIAADVCPLDELDVELLSGVK